MSKLYVECPLALGPVRVVRAAGPVQAERYLRPVRDGHCIRTALIVDLPRVISEGEVIEVSARRVGV